MSTFDSAGWDERYRASDSVWGPGPNRWIEQEVAGLEPGVALDLGCGEGRNAIWLDSLGWSVIAVDFSAVALEKAALAEQAASGRARITWVHADAITYRSPDPVGLALIAYLQVTDPERRQVVRNSADSLVEGGTLLVVAHDARNLREGTGGPQDPDVLWDRAEVAADLYGTWTRLDLAKEVLRPVEGAQRPAIDTLVRATKQPAT